MGTTQARGWAIRARRNEAEAQADLCNAEAALYAARARGADPHDIIDLEGEVAFRRRLATEAYIAALEAD